YPLDEAAEVTGFHAADQTRPLAVERDYAPGVLGSLREADAEDVEDSEGEIEPGDLVATGGVVAAEREAWLGTSGVDVIAADPDDDSARRGRRGEPGDGTEVRTTIDDDLQRLATEAIAGESSSAIASVARRCRSSSMVVRTSVPSLWGRQDSPI